MATRERPAGDFDYEQHGHAYASVRQTDPRIEAQVHQALGASRTVLNVGAGAGSYEPADRYVLAVEPSATMRAQRPAGAAPAVDAAAEHLPFDDDSFDAVMATMTIHQWGDVHQGLREMRRVSRGPVVVLTLDAPALQQFWLSDYIPEVVATEEGRFPQLDQVVDNLAEGSAKVEVAMVAVPNDCSDGFGEAFFRASGGVPPAGYPCRDVRPRPDRPGSGAAWSRPVGGGPDQWGLGSEVRTSAHAGRTSRRHPPRHRQHLGEPAGRLRSVSRSSCGTNSAGLRRPSVSAMHDAASSEENRPDRTRFPVPTNLLTSVAKSKSGEMQAWMAGLPERVTDLARRWGLNLSEPFQPGGSGSWVAPARDAVGRDAVLKVGWTHTEARDEAEGLTIFGGEGAVEVYAFEHHGPTTALLLERCRPGHELRTRPEDEQHEVVAELLNRLWQVPLPVTHRFRPLGVMCDEWAKHAASLHAAHPEILDPGLVRVGLDLFRTLPQTATEAVLLCTDLHAGNVLSGARRPWLLIDPKPYVGDPHYDVVQHLLSCTSSLQRDPHGLVRRVAGLAGLAPDLVQQWLFARCIQECPSWPALAPLARRIAPDTTL